MQPVKPQPSPSYVLQPSLGATFQTVRRQGKHTGALGRCSTSPVCRVLTRTAALSLARQGKPPSAVHETETSSQKSDRPLSCIKKAMDAVVRGPSTEAPEAVRSVGSKSAMASPVKVASLTAQHASVSWFELPKVSELQVHWAVSTFLGLLVVGTSLRDKMQKREQEEAHHEQLQQLLQLLQQQQEQQEQEAKRQ